MEPVTITARDGREMLAYLTLPVGVAPERLPLVLMPHGGPWARDWWGFDPSVQLWANRGYAVLQPQFRGPTGSAAPTWRPRSGSSPAPCTTT